MVFVARPSLFPQSWPRMTCMESCIFGHEAGSLRTWLSSSTRGPPPPSDRQALFPQPNEKRCGDADWQCGEKAWEISRLDGAHWLDLTSALIFKPFLPFRLRRVSAGVAVSFSSTCSDPAS
ncbi:hypothetical protein VTJ04DRAFT_8755 [Mycothermus thermophilus]|uniref:uncharacterized protein n=1 Tax=Humicola insolens TaxID=85995 RepID=UPI0037436590